MRRDTLALAGKGTLVPYLLLSPLGGLQTRTGVQRMGDVVWKAL